MPERKTASAAFQSRRVVRHTRECALAGLVGGVAIAVGVAAYAGVLLPVLTPPMTALAADDQPALSVPGAQLRPMTEAKRLRLERLRAEAEALRKKNAAQYAAKRAIGPYVHFQATGDRVRLSELADLVVDVPGGGVIFDVKGSRVYYGTQSPTAKRLGLVEARYDLDEVVRYLKDRGLYVMVRYIAVKDEGLAKADPATQIRHPQTGVSAGDVWVDPAHETTLQYNREILEEIVASGVDEINFDYIRYPTEYALADVGLTGDEKAARVETFLQMARKVVDDAGGTVKIGISTYAILGWDFDVNMPHLGQDFVRFAPLVDIISPMAYPASFGDGYTAPAGKSRMYHLVHRTLTGYADLLGPEQARKLRPWIQGYSADTTDMREQIRAVYDAGSCGFTIWQPGSRFHPFAQMLEAGWMPPEGCPR